MPNKGAQNVIIVEWPIHDPVVGISLASTQNTLVVMCKSNQVYSIIFVVICINFPKKTLVEFKITYSPLSKSYRATEKSSLPATRYLPSCEISTEFTSFCFRKVELILVTYKIFENQSWFIRLEELIGQLHLVPLVLAWRGLRSSRITVVLRRALWVLVLRQ